MTAHSASLAIENILFFTLLQLIVIIFVARIVGNVFVRFNQPRAVGEIIAGVLLGPSLFGYLSNDLYQSLFFSTNGNILSVISQIGVILLMFQIGLELDIKQTGSSKNRNAIIKVSLASIALPITAGFVLGMTSWSYIAPETDKLSYSLFIATALSITAVPILGRILESFGLSNSRLGVVTISSAIINDVVGWILLSIVAAITVSNFSMEKVFVVMFLLIALVVFSSTVARSLATKILERSIKNDSENQSVIAFTIICIFAYALMTSSLGVFGLFGGFLAGVVLGGSEKLVHLWRKKVYEFVKVFFLPIFFVYTGLRTNIGSISGADEFAWCGIIIAVAFASKFVAGYFAARSSHFSREESTLIGILLNTRALMELVVINVGYDLGVIPDSVFAMLVIMAILTTIVTAPVMQLIRICRHTQPVFESK